MEKETSSSANEKCEKPLSGLGELDVLMDRFAQQTDYTRGLRDGWLLAQGRATERATALEAELDNSKRDAQDWYDALAQEQRKVSRLQGSLQSQAREFGEFVVASDKREALLATELAREKEARDKVAASEEAVCAELARERKERDETQAALMKRLEALEAKQRDAERHKQDVAADLEECDAVLDKYTEKLSELVQTVNQHSQVISALACRRRRSSYQGLHRPVL